MKIEPIENIIKEHKADILSGFLSTMEQDIASNEREEGNEDCFDVKTSESLKTIIEKFVDIFFLHNGAFILQLAIEEEKSMGEIGHLLYCNLVGHGVGFWEYASTKVVDVWLDKYKYKVDFYFDGEIHSPNAENLLK